jgi:hypothetical protein
MTANQGVTNKKWLEFWCDNTGNTLTNLSTYLRDPGEYGLDYPEDDQTGLGERVQNFTHGIPSSVLSVTFRYDTVVMAHFAAIETAQIAGTQAPLAFDFRQGVGHAWEPGEHTYGCTATATSGVYIKKLTANADSITVDFSMFGGVAPTRLTVAHT